MKLRSRKLGLGAPLLLLALLGGTGCSQSSNSVPAASARLIQVAAHTPDEQSQAAAETPINHEFVYKADKKLKAVSLVGSFNKWDKAANPMKVGADGLTWRLTLPLTPGRYVYKLAPFGDKGEEPWIVDPNAPRDETDKVNDNSLLIIGDSKQTVNHAFVYKADKKLQSVRLVGSFNKWDKTANPMKADADGLTWRLTLPLAPGRYVYKFAPFGDKGEEPWVVDPNAPRDETDKTNDNSLLVIAPPGMATQQAGISHEFVYKADKKLKAVSLVGSFNKWDKTANPMKVGADGLTWHLTLPLNAGRYVYKFVLFGADGSETWIPDPHEPLDETDQTNDNSLLIVKETADVPANPNDGKTDVAALSHPHGVQDINYDGRVLALTLRARTNDLSQIWLRSAGRKYPMKLVRSEPFYSYYEVKLPWNRARDLTYDFALQDGNRIEEYGVNGLSSKSRPFRIIAKSFQPYFLSPASQPLKMTGPLTTQRVAGPAWAKNQPLYEVNLDVYGFPKGAALREFEKHLPVLKAMGVGLLWFMPLHPRGQKKGYGSPYAVRDFTGINPDFGTKAEFRHLVERAHQLGMRVLVDWVANHTAWDNPLIESHPEFYEKDARGEIVQAGPWPDVAQLDYGKPGQWNQPLWNLMRDDMTLWIREFGIDGFRCDAAGSAGKIPAEFWNWLHPQLNAVKPVFMLGEGDDSYLHPAFDMTYSWNLPPVLWDVCAGRRPATAIDEQLRKEARRYPVGAIQMRFLDNHDWHGNADWGWGSGAPLDTAKGLPQVAPLMVLCATLPGKPLLYNGQEMSFPKTNPPLLAEARRQSPVWTFYDRLLHLYGSQPAIVEGDFTKIVSNHDDIIYAFTRQRASTRILVVVNLSDRAQTISLKDASLVGAYRDWFNESPVKLAASPTLKLAPWDYRVYVAQK